MKKRSILAGLFLASLALPASAVSVLQFKGGYETPYTGQTSAECNVATGNFCSLGTAFDNSSNKYINALAVFVPGSAWSPTGGRISCWLLPQMTISGTPTYETDPTTLATARGADFSINIESGTSTTAVRTQDGVQLKPVSQKMKCYNESGATPPTGTTIYLYPYVLQMN